MKKTLIILTLVFSSLAIADTYTVGKWKLFSGRFIESQHDTKDQCLTKMESIAAQEKRKTYACVQRIKRVVDAAVDTTPIPEPDPIPDPIPTPDPDPTPIPDPTPDPVPPTTGSRCTPNANPSNYTSRLSGTACLSDGLYTQGLNVPSGVTVMAEHIGGAEFKGGDSSWSSIMKMQGSNSTVDGIKVNHPSNSTSDACSIGGSNNTMRNSSCSHGGTYKHVIPLIMEGSGHLVEDSWFYGEGRYVVQCFTGDHITLRRNVARWDSTTPNEPNEPNATFSIYNCSDMTVENNISLDYGVPQTPMEYGGDFYSPNHFDVYPQGNHDNHYFGNIVVNHAAGTNNNRAFRADNNGGQTISGGIIKDFYMKDVASDFVIKFNYQIAISNCTRINVTSDVSNIACTGADITKRYKDGIKTSEPLFPFANEALIKSDMCASRQSKWCTSGLTLEAYIND